MSSCSWSRSAYCVSTLCIRSSIEPATIRYRRIIAYIYCSSCLSKRPNDRAQVFNPHNRRLPNLLSSRQSLLTPRSSLAEILVDIRTLGRSKWSVFLLPYPEADKRTRRRTPFPSMRRFKSLPSLDVRAQWKHHSRLLRRSWALLFFEPTVMRQRNGGVTGSVTGGEIRQREPPRVRARGARISSVITFCGRRSPVRAAVAEPKGSLHSGSRPRSLRRTSPRCGSPGKRCHELLRVPRAARAAPRERPISATAHRAGRSPPPGSWPLAGTPAPRWSTISRGFSGESCPANLPSVIGTKVNLRVTSVSSVRNFRSGVLQVQTLTTVKIPARSVSQGLHRLGHYHNAYHNAERVDGGLRGLKGSRTKKNPCKWGLLGSCRIRIRT